MTRAYRPSPLRFVADNVELYESTGGTMGASLPDMGQPVLILTTIGARSGAVRKTPLMRVFHEGRWLFVGSMGGQARDSHRGNGERSGLHSGSRGVAGRSDGRAAG
jgi:hypothetical protein